MKPPPEARVEAFVDLAKMLGFIVSTELHEDRIDVTMVGGTPAYLAGEKRLDITLSKNGRNGWVNDKPVDEALEDGLMVLRNMINE